MALARVWSICSCSSGVTCANEAIESTLYAVAYTFVGSGVLNRHFLVVILMLQNPGEEKHSCVQNIRKLSMLFPIVGLLSHTSKIFE